MSNGVPKVILGSGGVVRAKDLVKSDKVLRQLRASVRPFSDEEKESLVEHYIKEVRKNLEEID